MKHRHLFRHVLIAAILIIGLWWSIGSADKNDTPYPNSQFTASAGWLNAHINDLDLIVVDVRTDKHFDGRVIPGAVRMPWSLFRYNDTGENLASTFVGVTQAQAILGHHGITANDTVVLYDSVERDGGATASYIFWVLDLLGHENKRILDQGIDGWKTAGFETQSFLKKPDPLLYQAGSENIRQDRLISGDFVYRRLGDRFYRIIDVRSTDEYLGRKGTKGLDGSPLKLGHIPTAVNINYTAAWQDLSTKKLKSFSQLQTLYQGIDPAKGIIVYCNSGRRSAFSYYVLRLMGYDAVYTYEASWKEWGNPAKFFPVETRENTLTDTRIFTPSGDDGSADGHLVRNRSGQPEGSTDKPVGGYISCGG